MGQKLVILVLVVFLIVTVVGLGQADEARAQKAQPASVTTFYKITIYGCRGLDDFLSQSKPPEAIQTLNTTYAILPIRFVLDTDARYRERAESKFQSNGPCTIKTDLETKTILVYK